ncbi:MAG: 3-aminobutanoyl-CoA transaminase [Acidobacteriota bacterium]|nr:3-aminobutanoyl-CoA transaminase [Acidobacteriota bacterium]
MTLILSPQPTDRYQESEHLLRRAETCDAWAATRRKQYNSIEGAFPIYASRAQGAYLWDVDNNRYIDYTMGYGTVVLGHADPRVNDAVIQELKKGTCLSPLWKPAQVELTDLLKSVIPGAEMAFLMKTGSDTTSGALRLARIYTGRSKVARWGYNGWHDWSTPRPLGVPSSIRAETLDFHYNDLASLKALFKEYPDQIACVLMMPFEVEKPYPGFLQEVKATAHEHGALFILDEMRSGFRMALGGAQEYFGIHADLATYSKSMSNGYPISAIVGRKDILHGVGRTKMTATFFANSAEMAAAITTISILRENKAIPHIWAMGKLFQEGIQDIITEYAVPARIVGYPPFPFIEFTMPDDMEIENAKTIFYSETAKLGVLFHPNHHWYISAAHTEEDIGNTIEVCRRGFELVCKTLNGN